MPGPGGINGSQPFKLTVESFNRPHNVAGGGARANAPTALNNAQPAAAPHRARTAHSRARPRSRKAAAAATSFRVHSASCLAVRRVALGLGREAAEGLYGGLQITRS